MESSTFVLLSGALTFGVPILLALRELVSLRRGRDGGGYPGDRREVVSPPPRPRGGAREHPRPLPACLIEAAKGAAPAEREAAELELA